MTEKNLKSQLSGLFSDLSITNDEAIVSPESNLSETQQLVADTSSTASQAAPKKLDPYVTSQAFSLAQTYQDVLSILIQYPGLQQVATTCLLFYFEHPWTKGQPPSWAELLAVWAQAEKKPLDDCYPMFPSFTRAESYDKPITIADVSQDATLASDEQSFYALLEANSVIYVPLIVRAEIIGTIVGLATEEAAFAKLNQTELMMLAHQTAMTLQVLHHHTLDKRRTQEVAALSRITQIIPQDLGMEAVLDHIYREVRQIIRADTFFIGLYDSDANCMTYPIVYDEDIRYDQPSGPLTPKGLMRTVIDTGTPVLLNRTPEEVEAQVLTSTQAIGNENKLSASLLFMPLFVGQKLIGVVSVQSYSFNAYRQREIKLLTEIAAQVAIVVENARLFSQIEAQARREESVRITTEQQAQRLAQIYKMSQEFSKAHTGEEVLQIAVRHICAIFSADQISIAWLNENQNLYHLAILLDEVGNLEPEVSVPVTGTLLEQLIQENSTIIISDTQNSDWADLRDLAKYGIRSTLNVPLMMKGKISGIMNLGSRESDTYVEQDKDVMLQVVSLATAALENKHLVAQLQITLDETQTLYDVSRSLSTSATIQETLTHIITVLHRHNFALDVCHASLNAIEVNEAKQPEWAEVMASWRVVDQSESLIGSRFYLPDLPLTPLWVKDPANPLIINDARTDVRLSEDVRQVYLQHDLLARILIPLRLGERWVGQLSLSWDTPQQFTDQEIRVYRALMGQFATLVDNQRLFDQGQQLATIVEHHPDFIGVGTLEGQAIYVNPSGLTMMGLPADHRVADMAAKDFYPADEAEMLITEGIPSALEQGDWTSSAHLRHVDGTYVPVEQTIGVNYDVGHNPTSFSITMRDITERQRHEQEREQLLVQLSQLTTVVETTSDFVGVIALDCQEIVYINLAGMAMIGQAGEDYRRLAPPDFRPPEVMEQITSEIVPVVFEEGIWSGEATLRHLNGTHIPTSEVIILIRGETNQPTAIGVIARDISEQRASEATLAKRATELETVARVSVAVSTELNTLDLLQTVVDLTQTNFNLYHTQIYLFNPVNQALTLAAGSGEIGHQIVAEGEHFSLNDPKTPVVSAARKREGIIINDVQSELDYPVHPLLALTRSEMAVPMVVGQDVLGVLAVKSDKVNYFTNDDLSIQTILAAQVAVALQNARSFERSEAAVQELDALTRRLTREGWQEYWHEHPAAERNYEHEYDRPTLQSDIAERDLLIDDLSPNLAQSLRVQGELIGQLSITGPQLLTEDADGIVQDVAQYLSLHLENLRLAERTRRALADTEEQAQRLAILNEMAAELTQAKNVDDVFKITAPKTNDIVGGTLTRIALFDVEQNNVEVFIVDPDSGFISTDILPIVEGSRMWQTIQKRRVIITKDTRTDSLPERDFLVKQDIFSSMVAPLIRGNQVIGTINVGSDRPDSFTSRDGNLMRQVASLVSTTYENLQLLDQTQLALAETEDQARRLTRLSELGAGLNQTTGLDEILEQVGRKIQQIIESDQASIAFVAPERKEYKAFLLFGDPDVVPIGVYRSLENTSIEKAIREKRLINTPDLRMLPQLDLVKQGYLSNLCVPLITSKGVIGTLNVSSKQLSAYSVREESLVVQIAALVASTIENQRLLAEAQSALNRAEAAQRQYTLQAWEAYREDKALTAYQQTRSGLQSTEMPALAAVAEAVTKRHSVVTPQPEALSNGHDLAETGEGPEVDAQQSRLLVPLVVRDAVIGILGIEDQSQRRQWREEEIALVETIVSRMAEVAENLRLIDTSQRRAAYEQQVNAISDKIQAAQSLEEALQIAVKEVGLSLKAPQTKVQLDVKS